MNKIISIITSLSASMLAFLSVNTSSTYQSNDITIKQVTEVTPLDFIIAMNNIAGNNVYGEMAHYSHRSHSSHSSHSSHRSHSSHYSSRY